MTVTRPAGDGDVSVQDQLAEQPAGQPEPGRRRVQFGLATAVVVGDQKELVGDEQRPSRTGVSTVIATGKGCTDSYCNATPRFESCTPCCARPADLVVADSDGDRHPHRPTRRQPDRAPRRIARELRQLRERAGMTLDVAARQLDMSKSNLSRIENAQIGIKPRDVRAALALYQVTGVGRRGADRDRPGGAAARLVAELQRRAARVVRVLRRAGGRGGGAAHVRGRVGARTAADRGVRPGDLPAHRRRGRPGAQGRRPTAPAGGAAPRGSRSSCRWCSTRRCCCARSAAPR